MQRHLKFTRTALVLSLLLVVSLTPALAQNTALNTQTNPALLIGVYYHAINAHDYATAYSYWEQPDAQTAAEFAQGFADTTSAHVLVRLPVFVDAGAGNLYAAIPTLITSTHTDGSTHYYAGCFTAHKTNVPVGNATEPDPNWYIQKGDFQEQATLNLSALDTVCDNTYSLGNDPGMGQPASPVDVIQTYLDQVASAQTLPEAVQAASYWVNPGTGDVLQGSYGDQLLYSTGLEAYINPDVSYVPSSPVRVPVFINATRPDQSNLMLVACLSTQVLDVPPGNSTAAYPTWYLTDGVINPVSTVPDAVNLLDTICS
ncbi:MAG: hypothetical protein H6672_15045 [Anaerolineaceae bacterium]|nr:hypothetical protein [Anaerolineaceae bacterium]